MLIPVKIRLICHIADQLNGRPYRGNTIALAAVLIAKPIQVLMTASTREYFRFVCDMGYLVVNAATVHHVNAYGVNDQG